jgi:hypothetical protein
MRPSSRGKVRETELPLSQQHIEKFLSQASHRIAVMPEAVPFPPKNGQLVIAWLFALAADYAKGKDFANIR